MDENTREKITLPAGIHAEYTHGNIILTKGGKNVQKHLASPSVNVHAEGTEITFTAVNERRNTIAILRSFAAHTHNLIGGLEKGYTYKLAVVHSHFPMNLKIKGDILEISNYLGEKNPRLSKIVGETKVEIKGKDITVTGNNVEHVSQTAANMEKATRDPKKDQRVFQDGIYITQKGAAA
ncbi:MAG: 50S ribosomal protein L6 [archaeon]